jgi:hypothetical protein
VSLDEAFGSLRALAVIRSDARSSRTTPFTPADVIRGFKRLKKNHGAIKLPKIGWVRFRGYRPLGGKLLSVTFPLKAGRWLRSLGTGDRGPAKVGVSDHRY